MIELFSANTPNGKKISIMLEEIGYEYKTTKIDLDKGDYGYCEDCGVEIGIKRLEALPTANLCIDCKSLNEIREKQTA